MELINLVEERKKYSLERISQIRDGIKSIPELKENGDLCIYVTGSYGRLEANEYSDLDLFFINKGSLKTNRVSNINKTLIDARLINLTRDLNFPEFSGDGEYLKIHYLNDMKDDLGSPLDDFSNLFTARLLLLLESRPLYNEGVYNDALKDVVGTYFRDYHDHHSDFKPIFLVNDIIRYWKTLCLNYEHKRNRKEEEPAKKLSNHVKNLKLKFSRLNICFSMIYAVSQKRSSISTDDVFDLCKKTPIDRFEAAPNDLDYKKLIESYTWFLKTTNQSKDDLMKWLGSEENRLEAFKTAKVFGNSIFDLINNHVSNDGLRFLVI
jgi:predicted nucleotidyltransferase